MQEENSDPGNPDGGSQLPSPEQNAPPSPFLPIQPIQLAGPPPSPSNGSGDDSNIEEEESFDSLFHSFSKKWMETQLTHHVSLSAANDFWKLSFKCIADIFDKKIAEGVSRKIPQYLQVRKNIFKDLCPEVKMSFVFLNKTDGTITHVKENHTPLSRYQRDPNYEKLYEEAHIEVIKICTLYPNFPQLRTVELNPFNIRVQGL